MGAEHAIKWDTSTLQTFGKDVTVDTVGLLPIRIICGRHVVDVDFPVVDMLDDAIFYSGSVSVSWDYRRHFRITTKPRLDKKPRLKNYLFASGQSHGHWKMKLIRCLDKG
jgi:hypothetical protein